MESKTYLTSVSAGDFILNDDGIYVATILATKHGLGKHVYIPKAVHRNEDLTLENVYFTYKVEINGDVKIFTDEPTLIRITIMQDS